jgi:hypothetical protein
MKFAKAGFEMPKRQGFQINFGNHHIGNAAKCFVFQNICKRCNVELPAIVTAGLEVKEDV